jgi:hypothetical protein
MEANVPRHLNKRPLIAGLEPIELLAVAATLIGVNVGGKTFGFSPLWAALVAGASFAFLRFYRRGKAPGHMLHLLRFQLKPRIAPGFRKGMS